MNRRLVIYLHRNDEAGMEKFAQELYDPKSPLFHHFLTLKQRRDRFSPSVTAFNAVARFLQVSGFKIVDQDLGRTFIVASAPAALVDRAFGVSLQQYKDDLGNTMVGADREPSVPGTIAPYILNIDGLSDMPPMVPDFRQSPRLQARAAQKKAGTKAIAPALGPIGTGGDGGNGTVIHPDDTYPFQLLGITAGAIRYMYGMGLGLESGTTKLNGTGQKLALFELGGWNHDTLPNYISYSANSAAAGLANLQINLRQVPTTDVLVDGYGGGLNDVEHEVELDVQMANAMADGLSEIKVYEAPRNEDDATLLSRIRDDDDCMQVSISYGLYESAYSTDSLDNLDTITKEMAIQGQSVFASSGDEGAYLKAENSQYKLEVAVPACLPWVTTVGGTHINLSLFNYGAWWSETTWNDDTSNSGSNSAGSGGIDSYFGIEPWQRDYLESHPGSLSSDVGNTGNMMTHRSLPDVSLDADPNSGYYVNVGTVDSSYNSTGTKDDVIGGTSASAPLWAAYTAMINQARTTDSLFAPIGLLAPALYQAASDSTTYANDFHDINDDSTNGYYQAVDGFDCATGLGTMQGLQLFNTLAPTDDFQALQSFYVQAGDSGPTTNLTVGAGTTLTFSAATKYPIGPGDDPRVDIYLPYESGSVYVGTIDLSTGSGTLQITAPAVPQTTVYYYQAVFKMDRGTFADQFMNVQVTVLPVAITGISVSPDTMYSGEPVDTATGTIQLNGPAPADFDVSFATFFNGVGGSDPRIFVPQSVTVHAGDSSASFPVGINGLFPSAFTFTIKAYYSGSIVQPGQFSTDVNVLLTPVMSSASVTPNPVQGGNTVSGTVTLQDPAVSSGVGCHVYIPPSLAPYVTAADFTVPVGQTTATFLMQTTSPPSDVTDTIVVETNYGGPASAQAISLTVKHKNITYPTTTTLTSSENPAVLGDYVVYSIHVASDNGGTPTGAVELTIANVFTIDMTLDSNGDAQVIEPDELSIGAGQYDFTASYVGDANHDASTSATLHQTINAGTTVNLTFGPDPSVQTQNVTFTATIPQVGSAIPTGTVSFYDRSANPYGSGGTFLGTATVDSSGKAVFVTNQLSPYETDLAIAADYSGDTNYSRGYSTPVFPTVQGAYATVTLSSSKNPSAVGQAVTFKVNISVPDGASPPSGTVTLSLFDTTLATTRVMPANHGVVTFTLSSLPVGSNFLTATYSGGLFGSGSLTQTVTDGPALPNLTYDAVATRTAAGYDVTVTATNSGTGDATGLTLTAATLNSVHGTVIPATIGTVAAGQSASTVLHFAMAHVASGSRGAFVLSGNSSAGSFQLAERLTLR